MLGSHATKTQSVLQSTVSLSSGESEYYAAVQGSATGFGLRSLLADWLVHVALKVASDSSAARGLASKRGLSKTRHIATRYLWLQEKVRKKELELTVVSTERNRGFFVTKALAGPRFSLLARRIGLRFHGPVQAHVAEEALVAAALVQERIDEAANLAYMRGRDA